MGFAVSSNTWHDALILRRHRLHTQRGFAMKRLLSIFVLFLSATLAAPAFAGGYGYHGGRHYHGGYRHHGGWNQHWVGPVLGAAIVGTAIYAASTPVYAAPPPPLVTVYPPVVTTYPATVAVTPPAPRVAYFCATSQQYYPVVPTCTVPWQAVSY